MLWVAVTWSLDVDVLQQRQEQERSADRLIVSSSANEAVSSEAVVRVTSDAVQQGTVSAVTTMATSSDSLPTRSLIPLGQDWLSASSKYCPDSLCQI